MQKQEHVLYIGERKGERERERESLDQIIIMTVIGSEMFRKARG